MDDEEFLDLTLNFVKRRVLTTIYAHPKRSPTFEEIIHMNGFKEDKVEDVRKGVEDLIESGVINKCEAEGKIFYYVEDEYMDKLRKEEVILDQGLSEGYMEDPKREEVKHLEEIERPNWLWK